MVWGKRSAQFRVGTKSIISVTVSLVLADLLKKVQAFRNTYIIGISATTVMVIMAIHLTMFQSWNQEGLFSRPEVTQLLK